LSAALFVVGLAVVALVVVWLALRAVERDHALKPVVVAALPVIATIVVAAMGVLHH